MSARRVSLVGAAGSLRAITALVLLMLAIANRANAQASAGTSTNDREQERTLLYREGVELAEAGRWADALGKFERVIAIRSAPRALLALGTAEEKSGKWIQAKRTYETTQADAKASGEADLASKAAAALRALAARIPHVTVQLAPTLVPEEVQLDSSPIAVSTPVEVDPGEHHLVVRAASRVPIERTFQAAPESNQRLVVDLPTNPAEPRPVARSSDPDRGTARESHGPPMGAWILGGAGVAATVIGLALRASGQSQYDDVGPACPGNRCTSPDALDRGNAGRDRMVLGNVVTGVGVASLAGAGAWWAVSASMPERTNVSDPRSARAAAWMIRLDGAF